MRFVYLHGFNSAFNPKNEKVVALSKVAPVIGVSYDTFVPYKDVIGEIDNQVPPENDLVYVGTSLGAFYASELGRLHSRPSVIINPCVNPFAVLNFAVDVPMKNFVTGNTSTLTSNVKHSYRGKTINPKNEYCFKPLLLVDLDDELLPARKTLKLLQDFPQLKFSGGCHRFAHIEASIATICCYIRKCSVAPQKPLTFVPESDILKLL